MTCRSTQLWGQTSQIPQMTSGKTFTNRSPTGFEQSRTGQDSAHFGLLRALPAHHLSPLVSLITHHHTCSPWMAVSTLKAKTPLLPVCLMLSSSLRSFSSSSSSFVWTYEENYEAHCCVNSCCSLCMFLAGSRHSCVQCFFIRMRCNST